MIRTINVAERGIYAAGAVPITVATNTSTDVIPDQTVQPKMQEIAYRYIQNVGANNLYYAIGQDASTVNYNGILEQYQQLDCSNHRLRISVYAPGGTTVATTVLYRNDQGRNNSGGNPIPTGV